MQISNYFFSVIIPVYNSELFLKKAISSILQEKIKDIEIILVNDRSDDRSLQICRNFKKKNKNIVLINNKKNLGPAETRNKGIKKAKGDYIVFLDSDDYFIKNSLKTIKKKIIQNNFPSVIINDSRRGGKRRNNSYLNHFKNGVYQKEDFIKKLVKHKIFINECWNLVIQKNKILKKNKFLNIRLAEDNAYVMETLFKMKNILVNKKLTVEHTTRIDSAKHLEGFNSAYSYLIIINKYLNLIKHYRNNSLFTQYIFFRVHITLEHLKAYIYLLNKDEILRFYKLRKFELLKRHKILNYNYKKFKRKFEYKLNKILIIKNKKNYKLNIFCSDWLSKTAIKFFKEKSIKINKIIDEDKNISGKHIMNEKIFLFKKIKKKEFNNSLNLICHQNVMVYKHFISKLKKKKIDLNTIHHFAVFK